jgi:hypothetical protein
MPQQPQSPTTSTKPSAQSSNVLSGDYIQDNRNSSIKSALPPTTVDSPSVVKSEGFVNGTLLNAAESVNKLFVANLSMHRFYAAALFTVGLIVGDKVTQIPFGKNFNHVKYDANNVAKFLKPVFGALEYESHSPLLRDRWLRVAHLATIGLTGGLGTLLASRYFFQSRAEKLSSEAHYLDEFEEKATFAQGKAWEIPTALSSIPGSAMGLTHLPFIPFLNYGTAQASRYLLASGSKIVTPVLGEALTNSHSSYRFGPAGLLDYMIMYATYNADPVPPKLNEMAQGILLPWFPKATPVQIDAFVQEVLEVRSEFFNRTGVPAESKAACKEALTKHFRKAGLEETLLKIGLNPEQATIASNGFIGASAEKMGARKEVESLRRAFKVEFHKRHPEQVKTTAAQDEAITDIEGSFTARAAESATARTAALAARGTSASHAQRAAASSDKTAAISL